MTPTSNFQPIRLLDLDCCYKFTYLMTKSADCALLQRQGKSGLRVSGKINRYLCGRGYVHSAEESNHLKWQSLFSGKKHFRMFSTTISVTINGKNYIFINEACSAHNLVSV